MLRTFLKRIQNPAPKNAVIPKHVQRGVKIETLSIPRYYKMRCNSSIVQIAKLKRKSNFRLAIFIYF